MTAQHASCVAVECPTDCTPIFLNLYRAEAPEQWVQVQHGSWPRDCHGWDRSQADELAVAAVASWTSTGWVAPGRYLAIAINGEGETLAMAEQEKVATEPRRCCHCGALSYSSDYCDPCNTDSCLVVGADGDTYCGRAR